MPYPHIPYKRFCWSMGTTSYRTRNFSKHLEWQLALLSEFWEKPEYRTTPWEDNEAVQAAYYDFLREAGFLSGNAPNKPKDARQKTSGLVDIGVIDPERRLTEVGRALLRISQRGDFSPDNPLQIARDSFLYLKQLLKMSDSVEGKTVRPFLVFLYLLSKLGYLTMEEYAFLLPLCLDAPSTLAMVEQIRAVREGREEIDAILLNALFEMDNYQAAQRLFLQHPVGEELMMAVGLNRKSRAYDRAYAPLYHALWQAARHPSPEGAVRLWDAIRGIPGDKTANYWRNTLFDTSSTQAVRANPLRHFCPGAFAELPDEQGFKLLFFQKMHLFKAKSTLSDYLDLNRRYIKNTDVAVFVDGTVRLDLIPKPFFEGAAEELFACAFTGSERLGEDCPLAEIAPCLVFEEEAVLRGIGRDLGRPVDTMEAARQAVEEERCRRFDRLVDERFPKAALLRLLDCFAQRRDGEINRRVCDNADIPTIFEYILGIIWYISSGRTGRILDYMKLSLDADLLPRTHAAGGDADIVYEYAPSAAYPAHSLLLEATLVNPGNQRNMEMEPVSRHLGNHLLRTGNGNSYCVFVTNRLHINVIADFRSRKGTPYYDTGDYSHYVEGMKIIPLEIAELKRIVEDEISYDSLYPLFERAFQAQTPVPEWYGAQLRAPLEGLAAGERPVS